MRWILALLEKITSVFKDKKKFMGVVLLVSLGIMLLAFSSSGGEEHSAVASEMTLEEYKRRTEEELSELCSSVEGVGKCRVTLTFERGAENSYKGSNLIESKPPKVLGVSVVCRGGDLDSVKSELTSLFQALYGIGSNRISVLKLNS